MQRLSPTVSRVWLRVWIVAIALWVVWLLPDTDGWQRVLGIALLVLMLGSLARFELDQRRRRARATQHGRR